MRWLRIFSLFIVISIAYGISPGFAKDPRLIIFQRSVRILAKEVGVVRSLGPWRDKATMAIQKAIGDSPRRVPIDVVARVHRMLRDPNEILGAIQREGLEAGFKKETLNLIRAYALRGIPAIPGTSVLKPISKLPSLSEESIGAAQIQLQHYYEWKLKGFAQTSFVSFKDYGVEGADAAMETLEIVFRTVFQQPAGHTQAKEVNEIIATLVSSLDESITLMRGRLPQRRSSWRVGSRTKQTLQRELPRLEEISRYLKRYQQALITRGMENEVDLLLTAVRFGKADAKRIAVHRLIGLAEQQGEVLSKGQLKEILSVARNDFRDEAATMIVSGRHISKESKNVIDAELQRLKHLLPDDPRYAESVETLSLLMQTPAGMENLWRGIMKNPHATVVERIAVLRALGSLETDVAVKLLRRTRLDEMKDPRILEVYVEEMMNWVARAPKEWREVRNLFTRMYLEGNTDVKRAAIRGWGDLMVTYPGKANLGLFVDRMKNEKNPLLKAEFFIQLARLNNQTPARISAMAHATVCLEKSKVEELRLAAALYILKMGRDAAELAPGRNMIHSIFFAAASNPALMSVESRLYLLRYVKNEFNELLPLYKMAMKKFVNETTPDRVTVEALLTAMKHQDITAAETLLKIFDRIPDSEKVRVLAALSTYQSKKILVETLQRVVAIYERGRVDVDLVKHLHLASPTSTFVKLLRGDRETIAYLRKVQSSDQASGKITKKTRQLVENFLLVLNP